MLLIEHDFQVFFSSLSFNLLVGLKSSGFFIPSSPLLLFPPLFPELFPSELFGLELSELPGLELPELELPGLELAPSDPEFPEFSDFFPSSPLSFIFVLSLSTSKLDLFSSFLKCLERKTSLSISDCPRLLGSSFSAKKLNKKFYNKEFLMETG